MTFLPNFTYRKFQLSDIDAINRLYQDVTGRHRTKDQFVWQWLSSPSGAGEIWLIHDESNESKLIGHHGVMPVRFTCKDLDLTFGKTENTMILPEYRPKIIYPRFEKIFKDEYQSKFHCLFSTIAPRVVLKLRKLLGYETSVKWAIVEVRLGLKSEFSYLISKFKKKQNHSNSQCVLTREANLFKHGFLSDECAIEAPFFRKFWDQSRLNYSIAPRRDYDDLMWRFWTNPYRRYFTYCLESRENTGYAIISLRSHGAVLEDYAVANPTEANVHMLGEAVIDALRRSNIDFLQFITTLEDSSSNGNSFFLPRRLYSEMILKKILKENSRFMPRYLTPIGRKAKLDTNNWNTTAIVLEGR